MSNHSKDQHFRLFFYTFQTYFYGCSVHVHVSTPRSSTSTYKISDLLNTFKFQQTIKSDNFFRNHNDLHISMPLCSHTHQNKQQQKRIPPVLILLCSSCQYRRIQQLLPRWGFYFSQIIAKN